MGDLEEAGQVRRALLIREGHRVLGREREAPAGGVVLNVAAGRLGVEPLAHVALGRARSLGELGRAQRSRVGEGAVEAELVAHDDEG
jgi:hypothetical protein